MKIMKDLHFKKYGHIQLTRVKGLENDCIEKEWPEIIDN